MKQRMSIPQRTDIGTQKKRFFYDETSGRSMIEMLGVLAIIGVLSVTGFYGYSIAIRRHRANEIVQMASILVTQAMVANGSTGACVKLSKMGMNTKIAGLGIEMTAEELEAVSDANGMNVHVQITSGLDSDGIEALNEVVQSLVDSDKYTIDVDDNPGCDEE